jgi:hypothetical protein
MKPLAKLGYLAAACAMLVTTFAIIGPRTVRAVAAALIRDSDNPARHPWAASCEPSTGTHGNSLSCTITAPMGEEVVIQNESFGAFNEADPGNKTALYSASSATVGGLSVVNVLGTDVGDGQPAFSDLVGTGTSTMYADPGTTITCSAVTPHPNPTVELIFTCSLSGYYVTLP